ncbi:MAG: hypothetical protein IH965_08100, partial [Gemmatimonadetes bacterium]|nr:hypothetical protein [Gemmatimonadota bacterium]
LSGTVTVDVDWSTGTATYSDLSVDLAGGYTLDATAGGTGFSPTKATSTAFSIT